MKTITKTIQYFLAFGSLLLLCIGCGGSSPVGIQPQMDPVVLSRSTDASGSQFIPLGSPVFIASQTSAIQPENYWIAWRDPELGYVAAAKSGLPVTPGEDDFSAGRSNVGRQAFFDLGLSVDVFQPADTNAVLSVSSSANVPPPPPSDCEERPRVVCDDCGICVRLPPRPCPTPKPEPTPEPEPITCDLCEQNTWSDPNYRSFDGLLSFTDSEGDFILARTLDGQVEIQARQKRVEGPGDSQNTGIAIRNGSDVVEFSVVFGTTAPGLILVNGRQVDVKDTSLLLSSGLQITYSLGASTAQGVLPNFVVRTSTGDTFRVETFIGSLGLSSQIVSQGEYEGILGDADGDPGNDWTPLGGLPLDPESYLTQEYGDFIESWRVIGNDSLFNSPFGTYTVSFTDWWYNSLSPEELRAGFELYEQLFGSIGDPYFAFRFAVDLAGGIPVEELTGLYDQVRQSNNIDPIPPQDADLNQDGIPDVLEGRPWDFGNLLNDNNQLEGFFTNLSFDFIGKVIDLVNSEDNIWVLEEICNNFSAGQCLDASQRLSRIVSQDLVPVLEPEPDQMFLRIGKYNNGVVILLKSNFDNEYSLSYVTVDGQSSDFTAAPLRLGEEIRFSNPVQSGDRIALTRSSSQINPENNDFPDFIEIEENDFDFSEILDFQYALETNEIPFAISNITKLIKKDENYWILANVNEQANPSILSFNLSEGSLSSEGVTVILDAEMVEGTIGSFVIRDIDLQGDELIAIFTGEIDYGNDEVFKISSQGDTQLLLLIPVGFGRIPNEKTLSTEKVLVYGSDYLFSLCEYTNPYSCILKPFISTF